MPISSVSRVYDAPDPILETDLELLAKVNTYQQSKFDAGEQALQNEVNNWAMLADVAKDQDRQYINQKLNKLVSGINGLGGVDLGDVNNVNSLKALGYNVYGDNAIINAVATTKKLRGFMNDAKTKLSGKDAKNYDQTYYEYNLDKWNDWLNDGQTGTAFNGPTDLPPGSFVDYQKRIEDAVNKLTPDMEEAPQGSDALNYLQIGSKFIKKERIKTLIDGMTTAEDRDIISAHAWKNMGGMQDNQLLKLTVDGYNSKIDSLKADYNTIKHNQALSQDFQQKQKYQGQLNQLDAAMKEIQKQKAGFFNETNGKELNKDQRQGIRDALYFDAFKDQYATAKAFEQNKTELKANTAKMFQLKEARSAYEFGETMKMKKAEYNLDVRKQDFEEQKSMLELGLLYGDPSALGAAGIKGPAGNAPLQIMENLGKDDATVMNQETVTNANTNYVASANSFYADAYNTIGSFPEYQKYVKKNAQGVFVPVDDAAKKVLDQAIVEKTNKFDEIAKLPLNERGQFEKTLSGDDTRLLGAYRTLQQANLYKQQVNDVEDDAFRKSGLESPGTQKVYLYKTDGNGKVLSETPVTYRELKNWQDTNDPRLNQYTSITKKSIYADKNSVNYGRVPIVFTEFQQSAKNVVDDYYERAEDGWNKVSMNYSPYGRNVTLPKIKGGGVNPQLAQYFGDKVRQEATAKGDGSIAKNVTESDVDINRIWVKYDAKGTDSKVRYMAEVKYKKGDAKKGDQLYTVDLTKDILNDPNSYVARMYPQDNAQIIYGMMMDKDGATPLDEKDNYSSALETYSNAKLIHKYQIVANRNPKNGLESFKMFVLIPTRDKSGAVSYSKLPVKNSFAGMGYDFPANYDAAVNYMNEYFKTDATANQFYQMHGITTPTATK